MVKKSFRFRVLRDASKENLPLIGVIGGVGPYAGLDFLNKVFLNTRAVKDQDHLNCMLVSCPSMIPDRTGFILTGEGENPALGMFESARRLYAAGARYAAVACNTAHAGCIFSPFLDMVKESLPELKIINMLETCALFVKYLLPRQICRIGLLATKGTYKSKVYNEYLKEEDGFRILEPDPRGQDRIHDAIYSEEYGIKANSGDIKPQARDGISYEINRLIDQGADAVILGCTELPLAVQPQNYMVPVFDPALLTARRLIEMIAPEKLRG